MSRSPLAPAQTRNRHSRLSCRNHPEARLVSDFETGDVICPECGLVVGDRLVDPGAEWRTFSDGANNSRVGNPEDPFFESGGLTTMIGPCGSGEGMAKYARYSKESAKDRSLRAAFRDMNDVAERLHLPGIVMETARGICKDVHDKLKTAGDHKGAMGIACLYLACKIEKMTRTFAEICQASPYTRSKVGKCFKEIVKLLKCVDIKGEDREIDFAERLGNEMDLPKNHIQIAKHVAQKAIEKDLFPSTGPNVITGAALLLVSLAMKESEKNVFENVVRVSGATLNALEQAYRKMLPHAEEMFPADFQPACEWDKLPKKPTYSK